MNARWPIASTLVLSIALAGCVLPPAAPPPTPPPAPPPKYYVASVATASATAAATEDGLKVLDQRALEALRPGITVAFFPPNACRTDVAAAATTATPEAVEIANECGVLISALETSVADRYTVVSWQTLKGADPFARAEARKVDVIFEVDSMGIGAVGQDSASELRIDFYEQNDPNTRSPVTLGPQELPVVAQRCKQTVENAQGTAAGGGMVGSYTGAIKAVDVKTGQALVYYKRTLSDDPGSAQAGGFDLYYESRGRQDYVPPPTPPRKYNGLQVGGVLMAGGGGAMAVIGAVVRGVVFTGLVDENAKNKQPGTAASAGVMLAGLFIFAGGVAMLAIGNSKAKKTPPPAPVPTAALPPPAYQLPAQVLCGIPTIPPWMAPPPSAAAPPGQGGSSYSFTETQTAGRDSARERENRLRKLVIDDFTKQLAGLGTPTP